MIELKGPGAGRWGKREAQRWVAANRYLMGAHDVKKMKEVKPKNPNGKLLVTLPLAACHSPLTTGHSPLAHYQPPTTTHPPPVGRPKGPKKPKALSGNEAISESLKQDDLSDFERARLENMQRNNAFLATLGLA